MRKALVIGLAIWFVLGIAQLVFGLDAQKQKSVIAGKDWQKIGLDEAFLLRAEKAARTWLDMVAGMQAGGGWAGGYKFPQMTTAVWPPYRPIVEKNPGCIIVNNTKHTTTARTALQFLYAYEALGDRKYLEVAKRTANLYLRAQNKKDGWWPCAIFVDKNGNPFVPEQPRWFLRVSLLIQDNVQTAAIQFLIYIHRLTGDERYLDGALKGAEFLLRAQNPNGSWSHHWDPVKGMGISQNSSEQGGELNDGATTNSMSTMLLAYHVTGDEKYLPAIKRAGDWIVEAQLKGPTFGWAAQYDKENNPVWARSFEPPSVDDGNGTRSALSGLYMMYHLTGDAKYLDSVSRCMSWLKKAKESDKEGIVWNYYDHITGRPIMAPRRPRGARKWKSHILFLDTDQEARNKAKRQPAHNGGPAIANGNIERREAGLARARREGPSCMRPVKAKPPTREALIARSKSPYYVGVLEKHEKLFPKMSGNKSVCEGFYPSSIFALLNVIRDARAAIGEIPLEAMKTRIRFVTRVVRGHAWPVANRWDTPLKPANESRKKEDMTPKTIEELLAFKKNADKKERANTGKRKLWGNPNIPPLVKPRGKVLCEDTFHNLNNWHHEGIGKLTRPELNVMQLDCVGSRQGRAGCMGFCRTDFPDNICIEYDMRAMTNRGLLITFIAAAGRKGEDMITELPKRKGIFADYVLNPRLRCYHVSISRYGDKGQHTGVSNWRRNPAAFMMAQQKDLCKEPRKWHHVAIVKKGKLLQMAVNGQLAGGFMDLDEIPEPIPTGGKIGFRSIGSDVRVQIRNFKVTALGR